MSYDDYKLETPTENGMYLTFENKPNQMTKLETLLKISNLQDLLNALEVDSATATIFVPNDNILKLCAEELSSHVYEPYEMFNNEERMFYASKGKCSVIVKSMLKFRKETILKEF